MQAPFYFISLPNVFAFFTWFLAANISLQKEDAIAVNLALRQHCVRSERKPVIRAELCRSPCRLAPPPAPQVETETEHYSPDDSPRTYPDLIEPFTLQIRQLSEEQRNIKLIWWYIAAINEDEPFSEDRPGEEKFQVELFSYEEALRKLTFQVDREVLQRAIDMVEATYG